MQVEIFPFDEQSGLIELRQQLANHRVIESTEPVMERTGDLFQGMIAVEEFPEKRLMTIN